MMIQEGATGRIFIGRLPFQNDLLESIEEVARQKNLSCAKLEIIGAVQKAVISYYHQDKKQYEDVTFDQHLEIVSCIGNISLKDGYPKAHVHISLSDNYGNMLGGHLQKGTVIFASEIILQEIVGPELHRGYDEKTGLPLWEF